MFKPRLTLTFAKPSPLMPKRESPPCHSERSEESPPSLAQGGRGNAWSEEHPQRHSERSEESPPFAGVRGLGGMLDRHVTTPASPAISLRSLASPCTEATGFCKLSSLNLHHRNHHHPRAIRCYLLRQH